MSIAFIQMSRKFALEDLVSSLLDTCFDSEQISIFFIDIIKFGHNMAHTQPWKGEQACLTSSVSLRRDLP